MAAARNVSHAATVTVWPSCLSIQASLAAVVVLPEPLTPMRQMTTGLATGA